MLGSIGSYFTGSSAAETSIADRELEQASSRLRSAVKSNDYDACEEALDDGADPDVIIDDSLSSSKSRGVSALHYSVLQGSHDIASLLVNKGCSLTSVDPDGNTALSIASRFLIGDISRSGGYDIDGSESDIRDCLVRISLAADNELCRFENDRMELEEEIEQLNMKLVSAQRKMLESEQRCEELEVDLQDLQDSAAAGKSGRASGSSSSSVVHRWYRVKKDGTRELIEGANTGTFSPSKADIKHMIVHEVVDDPSARSSVRKSGGGRSSNSGHRDDGGGSDPYMGVRSVSIGSSGEYHTGLLTVEPRLTSASSRPHHAIHQWYRGDSQGGWNLIVGATNESYQPSIDDVGVPVRCSYVPVDKDGKKGSRLYAETDGPIVIEPNVRDVVTRQLSAKDCTYEVFSKDLNKNVNLLIFNDRLKVREGKNTKLKNTYHSDFVVSLNTTDTTEFTIFFDKNVKMEFKVDTARTRDIVCLAIRSFCLLYLKKRGGKKGKK